MSRTIKTAVSLRQELFEESEALAARLKLTRSGLFARALQEFIRSHRNRRLLQALNAAYKDEPDPAERALQNRLRRVHRRLLEGEG